MTEISENCVTEAEKNTDNVTNHLNGENSSVLAEEIDDVHMIETIGLPTKTTPFRSNDAEDSAVESEIQTQSTVTGDVLYTETRLETITEVSSEEISVNELQNQQQTIDTVYFSETKLMELSRYSWRSSVSKQRYLKGCVWSPDGTCILTVVNCDGMHVIELPQDLYGLEGFSIDRPLDVLQSAVHVKEGGLVYDYCWYPFMNSYNPSTCCWLASRQHEPIQLWDAYKGNLISSYRGYNAVDEVEAAISCCFSSDGLDVIGGYRNSVKVFKTEIPGRDFISIPTKTPVSAVLSNNNLLALGSWQGAITIYDNREEEWNYVMNFRKYKSGITYLKFLHCQSNILVSGARKNKQLLFWDIRNTTEPILEFSRNVNTNQRIYFDISMDDSWLVSGDTSGIVHAWDITDMSIAKEYKFPVHHDCCNGVSIHPTKPILATSSGQHHNIEDESVNDVSEGINGEVVNGIQSAASNRLTENALILWWCGLSK